MAINDLLKNSTRGEVPQQNLTESPNLSQRIDQKLSEIAQRNPVIGKFFASAVGGVKGFVENPIQGARGIAGGIVAAPEKFIRTIGAAANKTTDSAYDEATGRPAIYIENGVPTLKQKKTLSGLIGGDPSMGQAIKLGEKDSLRKSTGLAMELGLLAGVPGLKGLSTAGKIGASSAIGAGFGITGEMQQDNPDYIAGAGAGFGIGGLLGGAGAIYGKVKGKGKGKTTETPTGEEKPIIPDGDISSKGKGKATLTKKSNADALLMNEAKKYKSKEEFIDAQFSKAPEGGMSHRPSYEGMPPAYDLLEGGQLPRDVYTHPDYSLGNGAIRRGEKAANESWNVLLKIRNKPEAEITVYRASPKNELRSGDWITLSKEYAKQASLEEGTPVNSFKVKAKDVIFAGDDINEFGFYPKSQLIDIWNKAQKVEGGVETKLSREIRAEYPELKKATYKQKTVKGVEAEALDIMNKIPDQVDDIAMGRRTTGVPALDSKVQELVIEKARKAGNIEKIGEIIQNVVNSKIGQSLALLQRSASDEYSFTNMLRKAQTLKSESIPKLKKVRHDYIKEQGKKEISEARKIKLKAAYKFLDDLIC